jgi:hypothetical protein
MYEPGGGNDDLPWLYTQSLQHIGGANAKGIVEELSSVNHIISENIEVKYHRSCCKSYTSKQNLIRFSHETVSKQENT